MLYKPDMWLPQIATILCFTGLYWIASVAEMDFAAVPLMYISCAVSAVGIIAGIPVASRYDRR